MAPFPSTEERLYRTHWQDGSLDLFAGLSVVLIGVAWLLDAVALGPVAPAAAIPLWTVFRRKTVEPRIGHVRFATARRRRLRRAHLALLAAGCAALILVAAGVALGAAGMASLVPALPCLLVAVPAAMAALVLQLPRFALYALVFVGAGLLMAVTRSDPGWGLLCGGLATTAAGGVLFSRFLRQFPVLSNELD